MINNEFNQDGKLSVDEAKFAQENLSVNSMNMIQRSPSFPIKRDSRPSGTYLPNENLNNNNNKQEAFNAKTNNAPSINTPIGNRVINRSYLHIKPNPNNSNNNLTNAINLSTSQLNNQLVTNMSPTSNMQIGDPQKRTRSISRSLRNIFSRSSTGSAKIEKRDKSHDTPSLFNYEINKVDNKSKSSSGTFRKLFTTKKSNNSLKTGNEGSIRQMSPSMSATISRLAPI